MIRNALLCLAILAAMMLLPAPGAGKDNVAEPECLKGTVAKVTENALHLKNANIPESAAGTRELTVLLDKDTKYYDGTKRITREALQPDHIVLVYCRMAGKDRQAALVRIIGGKKL